MGYVKRKANTKSKVTVKEFEVLKAQFIYGIEVIIEMDNVLDKLVINWDHTEISCSYQ